ncbi:MAG: putative F420-dependent oxidoreductase [Gammaproteobacteria bacterium]|jgi:probable F420-dependent oxidoreductase
MKVGLFAPLRSPVCTPELLTDLGKCAEDVGLSSIWMGEHVVMFEDYDSKYPGSTDGVFRFPQKSGLLDMTATLGFLAACTKTLRLGTGIRILPQANPVYTAKEYATLDFISGGRIDMGVGVGWSWEEFEACGVPWPERGARCDEYLEVMRTLWTDERSSFKGRFYNLPECIMYPKPVQTPTLPVTVGGHSNGALRRAAKYGAGWYGINLSPSETTPILKKLNTYLEQEGREPNSLRIVMGTTLNPLQPAQVAEYADVGVDEILMPYVRQSHKWLESYVESLSPFVEAAAACG